MNEEKKGAPTTAPTGKNNSTKLIVIVVIVLVILSGIGYAAQRFFARKTAENIVENATGLDVSTSNNGGVTMSNGDDTISTGDKAKWPSTMPSDVPEFKSGTIAYSSASASDDYKGWSVTYSDVTAANATSYFTALTGKGWAQTDSVESSLVTNKTFEKGTLQLNFTLDLSSNGATIAVGYK